MMTFAFFLLGGLAGIFAWFYIDRFIPNLQQEIYQNYVELYPENRPIFHSEKALIQSQKCGHIFRYFLGFGLCFAVLDYFLQDELFTLWLAITLSLIFVISWLDWHYQLISPTPCLFLFFLGLFGAHQEFSILTLSQSLESAVSFFSVFYIIYIVLFFPPPPTWFSCQPQKTGDLLANYLRQPCHRLCAGTR